jgi:hypothetical protein
MGSQGFQPLVKMTDSNSGFLAVIMSIDQKYVAKNRGCGLRILLFSEKSVTQTLGKFG